MSQPPIAAKIADAGPRNAIFAPLGQGLVRNGMTAQNATRSRMILRRSRDQSRLARSS
jgi:hypothetical protein